MLVLKSKFLPQQNDKLINCDCYLGKIYFRFSRMNPPMMIIIIMVESHVLYICMSIYLYTIYRKTSFKQRSRGSPHYDYDLISYPVDVGSFKRST